MPYYGAKGDFYTGRTGYYRGDPGFFSNLFGDLKNIVTRNVIPAVTGFATGGPIGAVMGAIGGSMGGGGGSPAAAGQASLPAFQLPTGWAPTRLMAGGPPMITGEGMSASMSTVGTLARVAKPVAANAGRAVMSAAGQTITNRLRAYLDPATGQTVMVPRRRRHRMNVTNPRALRRALRRAHGFEKLAMRTIRIISPKRHGRFGGWKRRTRKR